MSPPVVGSFRHRRTRSLPSLGRILSQNPRVVKSALTDSKKASSEPLIPLSEQSISSAHPGRIRGRKVDPVRARTTFLLAYHPLVQVQANQILPCGGAPVKAEGHPDRMVAGSHYDDTSGTTSSTHPVRAGTALPLTRPPLTASSPSPHTARSTDPSST